MQPLFLFFIHTHTLSPTLCPSIANSLSLSLLHTHSCTLSPAWRPLSLLLQIDLSPFSFLSLYFHWVPTLHHPSVSCSLCFPFSHPSALLLNYPHFSSLLPLTLVFFVSHCFTTHSNLSSLSYSLFQSLHQSKHMIRFPPPLSFPVFHAQWMDSGRFFVSLVSLILTGPHRNKELLFLTHFFHS